MPMGVVSDKDFEKELTNSQSVSKVKTDIPSAIIKDKTVGRPEGVTNVPDSLRKVIGETHAIEGRQEGIALAREFGLSPQSADAYGHGATSLATNGGQNSYDNPSRSISSHITKAKDRVVSKARNRLIKALNQITDEKLEAAKVKDIAGVAKDMSAIIRNIEGDNANNGNQGGGPTFVFYAPRIVQESHFDVVAVNE